MTFDEFVKTWNQGMLLDTDDAARVAYLSAQAAWDAAKPKWLPIETAPDCEHILILVNGMQTVGNTYDGRWWATLPNGEVWDMDHPPQSWMPLLEAPEQQGG